MLPAFGLALSAWTGLTACKPVDISQAATDSTSTTVTAGDSATLRVTNNIDIDPGTITIALFPAASIDIVNANKTKDLGLVGFGKTQIFQVPAGNWKLAYADRAGALHPMINAIGATQDWVKSIIVKNGDYALVLKTDGNEVVWVPTFKTDPAL